MFPQFSLFESFCAADDDAHNLKINYLTTLSFNEHQEQFFRCADDEREKENKSSAAERTDYLAVSQTRESGAVKCPR